MTWVPLTPSALGDLLSTQQRFFCCHVKHSRSLYPHRYKWWVAEMSAYFSLFNASALLSTSPGSPVTNVVLEGAKVSGHWHSKLKFSHLSKEWVALSGCWPANGGGFKLSRNFDCTQWSLYNVIYSWISEISSVALLAIEAMENQQLRWAQQC